MIISRKGVEEPSSSHLCFFFIELSCLTAFAAAAVMRLEILHHTVPLKAVETSNLLQHNGSVVNVTLVRRSYGHRRHFYHHFFLNPLPIFRVLRAVLQFSTQTGTQMLIIRPHMFNVFPIASPYKVKTIIVFLCVDPHLVGFSYISYLNYCRLGEMLGGVL